MVAISSSPCALNVICGRKSHPRFCKNVASTMLNLPCLGRCIKATHIDVGRRKVIVFAKSKESEESVPSWAKPGSDEPPPWARNEGNSSGSKEGAELPFFVYLLASAITAIAAQKEENGTTRLTKHILMGEKRSPPNFRFLPYHLEIGSIFEYVNQKPVFGVLNSDSIFYAPVLGFFAITGVPTSAFLWYKSVQVANKEAEEQDKRDGY